MSGNHGMRTHRGLGIEPSAGRKEAVEGGTRNLFVFACVDIDA